jgi:hypothetical protein
MDERKKRDKIDKERSRKERKGKGFRKKLLSLYF